MPPRRRNFNVLLDSQTTTNAEGLRRSPRILQQRISATNAEILRRSTRRRLNPTAMSISARTRSAEHPERLIDTTDHQASLASEGQTINHPSPLDESRILPWGERSEDMHQSVSEFLQTIEVDAPLHEINIVRRDEGYYLQDWDDVPEPEDAYLEDSVSEEDIHADMRLDIEHMSHEELLAVGENIGDADTETGLSRENILAILGRHRYRAPKSGSPEEKERCCICQEDYVEGELIGELDCAHLFHHYCIEQWLLHKNACPLCKRLAMHPVDFWGYPLE